MISYKKTAGTPAVFLLILMYFRLIIRKSKAENSSFIDFAFDPDMAIHGSYNTEYDHHSKAGSFGAFSRIVGFSQALKLFGSHAHAGVFNFDGDLAAVVVRFYV